jgi:hypothetical protein
VRNWRVGGLALGQPAVRHPGAAACRGHAQQAGTNLGTLAWVTTVTDATGRRADLTWLGQPALTPEGATMATDADDREQQQQEPQQLRPLFTSDPQQQRELEEIRRQFAEVGERMGSAFEPASTHQHRVRAFVLAPITTPPDEQPAPPDQQPARPRRLLVAAVAVLLVGTGFGYALPRARSNDPPSPPPQPQQAQPVPSVPQVCLETARRADETIHLLTINDRSRRLAEALKAYTLASQACRQQASP